MREASLRQSDAATTTMTTTGPVEVPSQQNSTAATDHKIRQCSLHSLRPTAWNVFVVYTALLLMTAVDAFSSTGNVAASSTIHRTVVSDASSTASTRLPPVPALMELEKAEVQPTNFAAARACRPSLLTMVSWVWITLLQFPVSEVYAGVVFAVILIQPIGQIY